MALCALCPHYETRGTSGVSLFLLNPQGASVYHPPKYKPIFSIVLWSPRMCVGRTSPLSHETEVSKKHVVALQYFIIFHTVRL